MGRRGLWRRPDGSKAYAATNPSEYFAELSMWLFGSHGEFVDRVRCLPAAGPAGLARYDPAGFALVGAIFDGTHPALQGDAIEPPPRRITPIDASARSGATGQSDGESAAESECVPSGGGGGDVAALPTPPLPTGRATKRRRSDVVRRRLGGHPPCQEHLGA